MDRQDTSRYNHSPSCLVFKTISQAVPVSSTIVVSFQAALWNDNGCFNFTTNQFTAEKAGRIVVVNNVGVTHNTGFLSKYIMICRRYSSTGTLLQEQRLNQIDTTNVVNIFYISSAGSAVMPANVGDVYRLELINLSPNNIINAYGETGSTTFSLCFYYLT